MAFTQGDCYIYNIAIGVPDRFVIPPQGGISAFSAFFTVVKVKMPPVVGMTGRQSSEYSSGNPLYTKCSIFSALNFYR
jgi:hypothetical protein